MIELIVGTVLVIIFTMFAYREGFHKGQIAAYEHASKIMEEP